MHVKMSKMEFPVKIVITRSILTIQSVSTGLKTSSGATEKVHLRLCALPRVNFYNFFHVCFQIQRRHISWNAQ